MFPAGAGTETVTGAPYFQWTPVQHASQYQLDVGRTRTSHRHTYETCMVTGTTYTPFAVRCRRDHGLKPGQDEDCFLQPGDTTYWRVRPLDRPIALPARVQGIYSATARRSASTRIRLHLQAGQRRDRRRPDALLEPIVKPRTTRSIKNNFGATVKSDVTTYSTSYTPVAATPRPGQEPLHLAAHRRGGNGTRSVTRPAPST